MKNFREFFSNFFRFFPIFFAENDFVEFEYFSLDDDTTYQSMSVIFFDEPSSRSTALMPVVGAPLERNEWLTSLTNP